VPAERGLGEAAEQMSGKAQSGAIMRGDPAGWPGSRLDLMQRPGQQAALGQQGVDDRQAERHGSMTGALDAMGAFEPADPLAQLTRNARRGVVGGGRSKITRGNDRHCPL